MRDFDSDILQKIESKNQTVANNAQPYASLKISRKSVPLHNAKLLDRKVIRRTDPGLITDSDIAVSHHRFKGSDETIWNVFIRNNKLYLRYGKNVPNILETTWTQYNFDQTAQACAIAFDSEVYQNAKGIQEFVTREYPFVFYVDEGQLSVIMMNNGAWQTEVLAEQNVTDVSVVRGPSSAHGGWDLGLDVFFLMNGNLYYRQFIEGVWYDAELVTLTIPDETYEEIEAFRTWDYRVGVQVLTASGKLYQIITFTEGIGARGAEHVGVKIKSDVLLRAIQRIETQEVEHIGVVASANYKLTYGHSAIPTSVNNIEDENENWGTKIKIIFDYPIHNDNATISMFTLVDSRGINYLCEDFRIAPGGRSLILTFADFNLAGLADNITVTYTKPASGGLMSPATQTNSFTLTFEPENLVPPAIDPPTFDYAINNPDGTKIHLVLTEEATNDDPSNMTNNFAVSFKEYNYVPNGSLQNVSKTVTGVSYYDGLSINIRRGTLNNTEITDNAISLEVDE